LIAVSTALIYAAYAQDGLPSTSTPGTTVSQLELISGQVPLTTGGVYDMSIQGSYSDGQNFSYVVTVALVSN
jgi:hypothetical protein